jgi:hypothetical protein
MVVALVSLVGGVDVAVAVGGGRDKGMSVRSESVAREI